MRKIALSLIILPLFAFWLAVPLFMASAAEGYVLLAPSITSEDGEVTVGGTGSSYSFGQYLEQIYITALIVAVIATIVSLVYGGILYIWPKPGAKSEAKTRMSNALVGLLLALTSWLLLNTINPNLLKFDDSIFGGLKKESSAPVGGSTSASAEQNNPPPPILPPIDQLELMDTTGGSY